MKILFINNNAFYKNKNGLFIFKGTGEMAKELVNYGHEVEMFQTEVNYNSKVHTFNVLNKSMKITSIKRYKSKILTYLKVYCIGILRVFKSDFIYIYFPSSFKYLALFAILFRKKYGLNVRGVEDIKSRFSLFLYKHAFAVFTVSPGFTDIVKSVGGNGFTQRPVIPFTYSEIVKDRIYNVKSKYNILFLARIDEQKGIFDLIEAVSRLESIPEISINLDIVGDGPDLIKVRDCIAEHGLSEIVTIHGAILDKNKLIKMYSSADLYVLPTYYKEGFPRTLYEAMIFGVPVVTTFVAGIPYLLKDRVNCYKIDEKSPESIFNVLLEVLQNYSSVSNVASEATSLVSEIFNPKRPSHSLQLSNVLNSKLC